MEAHGHSKCEGMPNLVREIWRTVGDIMNIAMMSGDSPTTHKDFFDFKEGRTTPPPTTSKHDLANPNVAGSTDVVAASVLADPIKEHGPDVNCGPIGPGARVDKKKDDEIISTSENPSFNDKDPGSGDKKDGDDTKKLNNGTIDKLDGKWIPPPDAKKDDDDEEENCTVKCLYYTLQCCECTIM